MRKRQVVSWYGTYGESGHEHYSLQLSDGHRMSGKKKSERDLAAEVATLMKRWRRGGSWSARQ